MTSDFRLPSIAKPPASGPPSRSGAAAGITLQLLRPIDAQLLDAGATAKAEVISSTARAGQFELMLRIARDGHPPAELKVTSRQPVPAGTQLIVQALNQTRMVANIQPVTTASTATSSPLTRLEPGQFPPDSTLQARVLTQQVVDSGAQQRFALLARIVQGAGVGSTLSLISSKPVEPGALLHATVGASGELRVAAPAEQLRQLNVALGLRDSLQRQASSEPLMSQLDRIASKAPENLPPAIRQVLMHVTTVAQLSTESGVAQAIKQSGLFLENNLAMLANALKTRPGDASVTSGAQPASPAAMQLPPLNKVLALLAGLATPPGVEPLPGADLKASLTNLLLNLQQQLPPESRQLLMLPPGPWQKIPGIRPGAFPLPSRVLQNMSEAPDLGSLLRLTAALLSRIQHHQLQSLGQSQTFADGSSQTVWQLEIPLRDGQQFSHVQVRIQRDDPAPSAKVAEPTPCWEVRLAFNLDPLGPLQAIARLYQGKVSSEFWAEHPGTLSLIDSELSRLRDSLLAKGLSVGDLSWHQGTPPPPRQAVQQNWVDEVT